jgi:quercetin dioxygenase-like cupin family protein
MGRQWRMAVVAGFIGLAGLAIAQTKSFTNAPAKAPALPKEMSHEPTTKQLIANGEVRAYRIDLAAGAETNIDRHEHDFLVISLGENNFEFAGYGNVYPMSMTDGEVQVMKGHWAHRVVNKSQHDLHLVEVEVVREIGPEHAICGLNAQACYGAKFAAKDDTNYVESPLFETATLRLGRVEIAAGKGMPEHGHKVDHLMIALNDQQVTNAVVAGDIKEITSHAGDAVWLEGGIVHRVMNRGAQPARFLTLECK